MSAKDWEQALTDAYRDYRWHQIMDPLCEAFQRWMAGELGHADVSQAIDGAYKKCMIYSLLAQREDRALTIIQAWDRAGSKPGSWRTARVGQSRFYTCGNHKVLTGPGRSSLGLSWSRYRYS
jgi:hypothetical protein